MEPARIEDYFFKSVAAIGDTGDTDVHHFQTDDEDYFFSPGANEWPDFFTDGVEDENPAQGKIPAEKPRKIFSSR
jgi:hypothetical protein